MAMKMMVCNLRIINCEQLKWNLDMNSCKLLLSFFDIASVGFGRKSWCLFLISKGLKEFF